MAKDNDNQKYFSYPIIDPPCYDVAHNRDCPNRTAGCSATCEKWKLYEAQRNEFYVDMQIKKGFIHEK